MTPDALAQLHALAFPQGRGWSAKEFSALLASPHCFLISRPHSFALGRAVAGEAELLTIATHPAHRKRGLGWQCLTGFETEAKLRGAEYALLEVAADNTGALALYQQAQYRECGRRTKYYQRNDGRRIDAILMRHDL